MFLAFMGISEGAIPFALKAPSPPFRRIWSARLSAQPRCLAGRSAMVPGVRYLGMAAVTNLGVYMAGIALGAVITALWWCSCV